MIPCRETTWERLLSVGFATLNATAKFGCIPAGYVTLPRRRAAFRRSLQLRDTRGALLNLVNRMNFIARNYVL